MKSFCSRVRQSQSFLIAVLASSAVFTAGCANMATTAGGSSLSNDVAGIGGRIHGGNQPVAGAIVQLWFAGQAPVAAQQVAQATSADTGAFSFVRGADGGANAGTGGTTFSCPIGANPLVYAISKGGNTQNSGGTSGNDAAVFVAPFGLCKSMVPFVDMTEVTTVATMAAWQQYFNPLTTSTATLVGQSFNSGGSGLSLLAMTNSFDLISNLVDLSTGLAVASKTIPGTTVGGGVGAGSTSVVATPESSKINTIANILSACINGPDSNAAACGTLFSNAAPGDPTTTSLPASTFPTATNTLQAVYYMLTNPTNGSATKLSNLLALAPAAGAAFLPTLTSAPSDWTIAINYASTSTCGATPPATNGHLINSAQDLAVDSIGGVWIANNESNGNLSYLTHTGAPATCVQVGTGALSGITIDYVSSGLPNVWLADSGSSNVYRYHPTGSSATAFRTAATPTSIAADGDGNVFFTSSSNSTLYEIPGGATASVPVFPATAGVSIATGIGSGTKVLVDSAPSVWTTSGSTSITRTSSATPDAGTGYTSSPITTVGPTYGIAVSAITAVPPPTGGTKSAVFFNTTGLTPLTNTLSLLQGIGATRSVGWAVTGLSTPAAIASDGAQNVWTINNASGANSVVEVGVGQQLLSPAGGFQKDASYLAGGRSLVIDSSGDVWIGLDGSNSITEIVGAAVPVYQPYAQGLHPVLGVIHFQTIP